MNILFVSIGRLPHIEGHSISVDLIHELMARGHNVYAVCAADRDAKERVTLTDECGCKVLRVKIGANKKANIIVKGITTLCEPYKYISAIKRYFSDVKFDLVMYPTPPVTQYKTVRFIKKRDGAKSYLLLKDIFPQNAVDLGMMKKGGLRGLIYRYFRRMEKRLYRVSDMIGCMSEANRQYVLKHNPEIPECKVEICPNSIEFIDMRIDCEKRVEMREKYSLPLDKRIFVYGGNLGKPQGIAHLMDSLRICSDIEGVHFLIVGDGTEYRKLEEFVGTEHPGNVTLMRKLPKEDYDRLVSACDVGMIFLDKRFTIPNFPSRLLGYMQAGLPVISCTDGNTDVGLVIEEGGLGLSCLSDDPMKFRSLVYRMLDSDLATMGENSISYLKEHYTVSRACDTIEKIF